MRSVRVATTIAVACATIAGASAIAIEPGCQLHNCDSSQDPPTGQPARPLIYLGGNTWASGPRDGTWLDFPGGRTELFDVSGIEKNGATGQTFEITEMTPYISDSPTPVNSDDNFTFGAGNVTEIVLHPIDPATNKPTQTIAVSNSTCAEYALWFVVRAVVPGSPPEPSVPADAGTIAPGTIGSP